MNDLIFIFLIWAFVLGMLVASVAWIYIIFRYIFPMKKPKEGIFFKEQ
jgi:hypothetical protein